MLNACVQKRSILRVIKFNKYLFDVLVPDANITKTKIGLESPIRSFSAATAMSSKLLTIDSLNPCVKNVEYAVRGPIVQLASKLEKELQQVSKMGVQTGFWIQYKLYYTIMFNIHQTMKQLHFATVL